jgi:SAM-dependent methyltransferase
MMSVLGRVLRGMLRALPRRAVERALGGFARRYAYALPPDEGLRFLFALDQAIYRLEGKLAIQYGGGLHTKHRHIRYHDFFVARIRQGERVLDVGCGNGALTYDMADKAGAHVVGIDIDAACIQAARAYHAHPNITYYEGDALGDLPEGERFDVIVLSNVLEHLGPRVDFLQRLAVRYQPRSILIRVPSYERDWRVPLQDELGIDYRLDPTHEIEYTRVAFEREMAEAGLAIVTLQAVWGELWVEVHSQTSS